VPPVPAHKPRLVRILDEDPDLGYRLDPDEADAAARQTVGILEAVPPGPWTPATLSQGRCLFGGLLLDGLLVRELTVGGAVTAELLGAGDLVLPNDADAPVPFVGSEAAWTALEPTRIAWLDGPFVVAIRRWPELGAALLERSHRRFVRVGVLQAIAQMTRIDDRVLTLLWQLAERWGRVRPDGVLLPLRLPHKAIAHLVGARRPSVTTAIGSLERSGRLERRSDGAWLLLGSPPTAIDEVPHRESPWSDTRSGTPSVMRVGTADLAKHARSVAAQPGR
jgi:hypothetical protein